MDLLSMVPEKQFYTNFLYHHHQAIKYTKNLESKLLKGKITLFYLIKHFIWKTTITNQLILRMKR